MSLLTGARRRNVASMNWKDVSFANNTWKLEETKNGESQIIHLSEQAISILQRRLNSKSSQWVFPSPTSASGHIEEPKKPGTEYYKGQILQILGFMTCVEL